MNKSIQLIHDRRSVRTFGGRRLTEEDREKLLRFAAQLDNPYNIPLEFKLLDAADAPLKCPVVAGTEMFIGAKLPFAPHMEEAFGFSFERLLLYALSLGIGSVWVGGTMDRAAFEQAMDLQPHERMLCMSPLGYPAEKMSLRETMMRKGVKADSRIPFEQLFFEGDFSHPLPQESAGVWAVLLEAVRLSPSAVNRQPWRVVLDGKSAHFYKKQSKGFISERNGDMQKIDMGIALTHFALAAQAQELALSFSLENPQIPVPESVEYIASYLLES